MQGRGNVLEDDDGVTAYLMTYLHQVPQYAKYVDVSLDANGQPALNDVRRSAHTKVVVQITLIEGVPHP